ncbi:hypothetical protein BBO99_00001901 [Phytophthora kernoviae]|uniref:Dynein intermediate chain n=2 Tax=Phytophthora kernoviae TaxID=325452 RepID=A0A3F2S0N2_9STRA|nr:hypothetical protein G195_001178 [Phytophthora kernoviae 00238/432]KAG2529213.1 hypothetical protein JM18_001725 [Phytophthora kernoviae]KAG2529980.1 hypothetical protein JM16_001703 [Phytophthora kernoviae]RLN26997.1 hypothetical protein BBI17_001758 [Phytophthora kernoviae]RLN62458.1 hypothetical protein BBJ29_003934 [Phytophthora kernoviae]
MDSVRAKHAAELEAKRKKLEEIRKRKAAVSVAEMHIQPTLVETYTKHTQTDITLEHEIVLKEDGATDMEIDESGQPPHKQGSVDGSIGPSSPRRNLMVDTEMMVGTENLASTLTAEEKSAVMQSEGMEAFLNKASRVIERALNTSSKYDIMIDYGADVEQDNVVEEATESLKQQFMFADDKWSKHRAVTDVDVSPFYPELMLVAYTARDFLEEEDKNDGSSTQQWDTMGNSAAAALTEVASITEGVVLLWSTALPGRPEYRFTCHSQVTSACFNPFDRHIIIGGTYSGQIVIWDTRAKSTPVQKTALSACSHTHPIYAMAVVGTKTSYNLISASTDGRVCVWDIDQLQQPVDMLDLRIALSIVSNYSSVNTSDKKMEASVTSFAVFRKENKELYIGTEAGKLYSTKLDQQKSKVGASDDASMDADKKSKNSILGSSTGDLVREVVVDAASKEGSHFGPVTAMHFNPLLPVHRDGLLLTCSLDSTVKLWSTEHPQFPALSFEPSSEYICDVRWSSVHPALFAVADGSGTVSIWNILKDVEVPAVSEKIGEKSLNKIRWSTDGKNVIAGGADGKSYIFEVPTDIALPQPDDLSLLEGKVATAIAAAALSKA